MTTIALFRINDLNSSMAAAGIDKRGVSLWCGEWPFEVLAY